jgi:iron complex outermembrane receptor protein|tara:strand:+ start:1408 stop:3606 length:2199 start_codon:yes stop_codon:yes gene_type:complete
LAFVVLLSTLAISPHQALAQPENRAASRAMIEEVVVTARKRTEQQQDVPIAISAFNSGQLDALKVRELEDLSFTMPNVALDDVGTTRGVANFSIRGLGINASILSIDPTVGVFVDGVYMGVNTGILFDVPDLESIEVLRGPQGVLFGRNVVGGAVLINTKQPGDEFEAKFRATFENSKEGGHNMYYSARVAGPISDNLAAGLTVFFNDDEGAHENSFTGNEMSAIDQLMMRPVVVWSPTDDLELVARYEYLDIDGDGTAGQSHLGGCARCLPGNPFNHDDDDFSLAIDEEGKQELEKHRFSLEVNWSVGENGTITNIFGWRDQEIFNRIDVDTQPFFGFHAEEWSEVEQISNELRYNVLIDNRINLTTGVFYFENDIVLHERRLLFGGVVQQDGGGDYQVESLGAFGSVDYDLSEKWSLSAGLRYTREEKEADITSLSRNVNNPCRVDQGTCVFDFISDDDWDSWSPKLGATYRMNDETMVYGHWSVGHRSGGYNLRNTTTLDIPPGPFDQERYDSYEIGFKTEFDRGRLNGAVFFTEGEDVQRVILGQDPNTPSGGAQVIRNAGDTETMGFELDGVFSLTDNLILTANLGWTDHEYTKVTFDINGDGVIDGIDKGLEFTRAPEWTYSIGLVHDVQLGSWSMSSRINYSHRDEAWFDDDNEGILPEQDIINAGIDFYSDDGRWEIGIYGKNLTNEVYWGGETVLPGSLGGGTFAPLAKPARYGVELTYNFVQ